MTSDRTFELFGPLANSIRELLVLEWNPRRINLNAKSDDLYDDYIPAIHRLVIECHATAEVNIEPIAAYLNFVVKNYIGETTDKELNHIIAAKIFTLAEAARHNRKQTLPMAD